MAFRKKIIALLHYWFRPCCVFDSANGYSVQRGWYWLHCRCGRTMRVAETQDRRLETMLFHELGLQDDIEAIDALR